MRVVGGARGVITVRCLKRSPGGFAPVVRGGTCRRSSGRGSGTGVLNVWGIAGQAPTPDCPASPRPALWKRHRRWSTDGTYQRIFQRVRELQDQAGRLDWLLSVDSTIVRAHQHAAGAPAGHTGGTVE